MDAETIIKRLRKHKAAKDAETIGVIGSYGKVAEIDDDGDKNDIVAIANTGDIDLDDEVVIPSGLTTEYLEKNRQIFVDHEYGISSAAGFVRSIAKYPSPQDHKSWRVRIGLYDNEAGRAVKEIAKRGRKNLGEPFVKAGEVIKAEKFTRDIFHPPARPNCRCSIRAIFPED